MRQRCRKSAAEDECGANMFLIIACRRSGPAKVRILCKAACAPDSALAYCRHRLRHLAVQRRSHLPAHSCYSDKCAGRILGNTHSKEPGWPQGNQSNQATNSRVPICVAIFVDRHPKQRHTYLMPGLRRERSADRRQSSAPPPFQDGGDGWRGRLGSAAHPQRR